MERPPKWRWAPFLKPVKTDSTRKIHEWLETELYTDELAKSLRSTELFLRELDGQNVVDLNLRVDAFSSFPEYNNRVDR